MKVHVDPSALLRTRWYEYVARFFFGGLITAITGVLAKKFGPELAGLFLAFPAIFPATATLIERHEKEKKQRAGIDGTKRSRAVAGVDATGTTMGCLGLLLFAFFLWKSLPDHTAWSVLSGATIAWFALSVLVWALCGKLRRLFRRRT
jgi:hypothetical protein